MTLALGLAPARNDCRLVAGRPKKILSTSAGVDVFFVISGFLITRLLYVELTKTVTINILNFYARRARRLLPALGVVLVATLGLGGIWLHR
jgi:peptidoglycan/LPS O-acetylase OafA/YrhL